MAAELMAGKGPDLFLFSSFSVPNLYKVMNSGVLCDLNPFFEADDDFDVSAFHEEIFSKSCYRGKRYYIPLSYFLNSAVTTADSLLKYGVTLSEDITFQEWVDAVLRIHEQNKTNAHIISILYGGWTDHYANTFGLLPFDPETDTIRIDEPGFRQTMELIKVSYPDIRDSYMTEKYIEDLQNNTLIFGLSQLHGHWEFVLKDEFQKLGISAFSFPVPTMFENKPAAFPYRMVAVSQSSNKKDMAYEFIQELLSQDIQKKNTTPIHNAARLEILQEAQNQYGFTDEEVERMYKDLQNVIYMHPFPYSLFDLLVETMEPWFSDEQSYEHCLEDFRDRLEVYINE